MQNPEALGNILQGVFGKNNVCYKVVTGSHLYNSQVSNNKNISQLSWCRINFNAYINIIAFLSAGVASVYQQVVVTTLILQ